MRNLFRFWLVALAALSGMAWIELPRNGTRITSLYFAVAIAVAGGEIIRYQPNPIAWAAATSGLAFAGIYAPLSWPFHPLIRWVAVGGSLAVLSLAFRAPGRPRPHPLAQAGFLFGLFVIEYLLGFI